MVQLEILEGPVSQIASLNGGNSYIINGNVSKMNLSGKRHDYVYVKLKYYILEFVSPTYEFDFDNLNFTLSDELKERIEHYWLIPSEEDAEFERIVNKVVKVID